MQFVGKVFYVSKAESFSFKVNDTEIEFVNIIEILHEIFLSAILYHVTVKTHKERKKKYTFAAVFIFPSH